MLELTFSSVMEGETVSTMPFESLADAKEFISSLELGTLCDFYVLKGEKGEVLDQYRAGVE